MSNSKNSYGQVQIKNKRARFEYQIQDQFIAGLALTGTEIKSIRMGKASLQEGYCVFSGQELWVQGMHIAPYKHGTIHNHEPRRKRKLLLNKRELKKLRKATQEKGATIIPLRLFINNRGLAKLEIAVAKGKKLYDKRQDIRKKEEQRELKSTRL